jgi:multidrug transporter EmrE-like cation transporter
MTRTIMISVFLSVMLSSTAQLLLKAGVSAPATRLAMSEGRMMDFLWAVLLSPMVWIGLVTFAASVLMWLGVLSQVPVSLAYPFVALGMIFTTFAGYFLYHEPLNLSKVAGTGIIVFGVIVLATGGAA